MSDLLKVKLTVTNALTIMLEVLKQSPELSQYLPWRAPNGIEFRSVNVPEIDYPVVYLRGTDPVYSTETRPYENKSMALRKATEIKRALLDLIAYVSTFESGEAVPAVPNVGDLLAQRPGDIFRL